MWGKRTVSLGVVFPFSSPSFLLHQWLTAAGINPDTQVRILVVPPSQMYPMLKLGYIDGFCAGEPWTSVSVQAGVGVCVASSAQLAPLHPEKVLMVRQSFSLGRAEVHERLLAALLEACAFCDEPENRTLLCDMLAGPQYVNAPAESLKAGLVGPYNVGDQVFDSYNQGNIFHRFNANDPSDEKAEWIMHNIYTLLDRKFTRKYAAKGQEVLKNVFRKDAYERAKTLVATEAQRLMDETMVSAQAPLS